MLRYANGIKANIDAQKELQQIIPAIIDELEEMLQNGDWNYANLQIMKKVEWTLLEFDLERLEQIADWKKIDKLRDEWCKMYNKWFKEKWVKKDEDVLDFAKVMKKMKEKLRKIEEIVSLSRQV
ncbi:hypothetical protein GPALN_014751 [Globodera pallida]|nr:hypothetical protein GPALN_014751 [Globodera pallida]